MSSGRWLLAVSWAVLCRPNLWATAIVQIVRLAPTGWWRRAPFLPVPPRDYLRFRAQTAYGDAEHRPEVDDVLTYLEWCRAWPHRR